MPPPIPPIRLVLFVGPDDDPTAELPPHLAGAKIVGVVAPKGSAAARRALQGGLTVTLGPIAEGKILGYRFNMILRSPTAQEVPSSVRAQTTSTKS